MARSQAVVLIHGIGEQRPMDTLRRFVDAVWLRHRDIHHPEAAKHAHALMWSKPDRVSESFEVRKLTTPQSTGGTVTDFYEFYWAHLMEGTTYGHVLAWARSLLLRKPSTVPAQLKAAWWLIVVLIIVSAAFAGYALVAGASRGGEPLISPWLSAIISLAILPAVGVIIKGVVGDAARYLHVAPTNVQRRHEIRQAGVKLLKALHERGYDRIIVVGHSLGSVIGYDVLTHAWQEYHWKRPDQDDDRGGEDGDAAPSMVNLEAIEALARKNGSGAAIDLDEVQAAQRKYLNELIENGNEWRVTDFITCGSPLAHAAVLMARDRDDLETKQRDRELPRCLPVLETVTRRNQEVQRIAFEIDRRDPHSYRVPHHAAVFAATRWTNLFFPSRTIVRGDLIGGPLADVFGQAIRDIPVSTTLRGGLLSHTLYWTYPAGAGADAATPPSVAILRDVLDLVDKNRMGDARV
jgi:hypothetical protein